MIGSKTKNILQSALQENDAHLRRIQRSQTLLNEFFPLSVQSFESMTEEQIEHIDQFIYRFTKMQDSMASRLIPGIYSWMEANDRPRPFLDILNRLEQLGLIEVEEWQFFRNLRNSLTHDYPESIEQTVQALNMLYSRIHILLRTYGQLREFCIERGPFDLE